MNKGRSKRKRKGAQRPSPEQSRTQRDQHPVTNPPQIQTGVKLPREPEPEKTRPFKRRSSFLLGPLWFVVGTVFGLYVVRWFVGLLPGPHVEAMVQGVRVTSGNAAGCTTYLVNLQTDDPIEYIYGKVQFPNRIDDFKFGYPQENETSSSGRMHMQAAEIGKSSKGACQVVQQSVTNEVGIQASAAGNMIGFSATKVPPHATIFGFVVTADNESSVNPKSTLYTEGAYEYLNLGQTVRKPLIVSFRETTNAK